DLNNNHTGQVSSGDGNQFNKTHYTSYNQNGFFTRRFRAKKGRTLNISHNLNYRSTQQNFITESENQYFYPSYSNVLFAKLRNQDIPYLQTNLSLSFAEPLSKNWTLRFNNRYEFVKDKQDINTYDKD